MFFGSRGLGGACRTSGGCVRGFVGSKGGKSGREGGKEGERAWAQMFAIIGGTGLGEWLIV